LLDFRIEFFSIEFLRQASFAFIEIIVGRISLSIKKAVFERFCHDTCKNY